MEGSRLALGSLLGRANARSWLRLAPFAIAVVAAVIGILVVARPAAAVGPAGICVSETLSYTYDGTGRSSPMNITPMNWRGTLSPLAAAPAETPNTLSDRGVATRPDPPRARRWSCLAGQRTMGSCMSLLKRFCELGRG